MTISSLLANSFLVETMLNPDSLSLAGLEQAFLLVRKQLRSFAGDRVWGKFWVQSQIVPTASQLLDKE